MMNVAVIGTGGREHALAVKCLKSPLVKEVFVIPGNSGMLMNENIKIYLEWDGSFPALEAYLTQHGIELIIVGNEAYLEKGIADYFTVRKFRIFGPNKKGASLEYSKDFAKQFMKKYSIPTAEYKTCVSYEESIEHVKAIEGTLVIKQDGLALGKGVLVTDDREEASEFIKMSFSATQKIVFEEFLEGKEFSLLAFVNQEYYQCMAPARDYKRAFDGDRGLNTGGMGAYTPVEYVTNNDLKTIQDDIIIPTVQGLLNEDIDFKGILYFGLMKTVQGIKVIEYNTRFGDPETEVLLEAMETDLIETIISTLDKKPINLTWKSGFTLGVCLASIGYPSTYVKGYNIDFTKDIPLYSMALKKEGNSYFNNGGRVLFVTENGETIEKARQKCYKNIETIKSNTLFFRTDIGL